MKIPQYRNLYETLRKQIIEGKYKEGELIPSENDLCSTYNLTRPTVRQALTSLVHEGYIKRHHGKGSVVQAPKQGLGILSIQGTTQGVGQSKLSTKIVAGPFIDKWEDPFMFDLSEKEKAAGCIRMERLRAISEKTILYEKTFLPNFNLTELTTISFENNSLFDTLRSYFQIEIIGGEQKIWAIPADKQIGEFLKVKLGSPILHLERKIATNRLDFYIYSSLYCNTESYFLQGSF